MAKRIFKNANISIIGWQTTEGFFLRAYEDATFKEMSVCDPNITERGNFFQRWF